MANGMAPVVAWALGRISFACIGFCKRLIATRSHALLLAEPHVSHSFFVERPAAKVDHERNHEQVNGSTNQSIHVLFSNGILSRCSRAGNPARISSSVYPHITL